MHLQMGCFDLEAYGGRLKAKGRVRLEGLLGPQAMPVFQALETGTDWSLDVMTRDGPRSVDRDTLARLNAHEIQDLLQGGIDLARQGLSFVRLGCDLEKAVGIQPALKALLALIHGPDFLNLCETLSGETDLKPQALRIHAYRPGDFVSQHTDQGARLGFEWNFTPDWRPDEGGQLLFHAPSGDIGGGILPRLDDLALFTGDLPRSVATLAAYARSPRLSLTGRFI